jgi:hypothetical protein
MRHIGNFTSVMSMSILCAILILAIHYKPFSNIHIVITTLFGAMFVYVSYQWTKGRIKGDKPILYPLVVAFTLNALVSFGCGWWFSGIVWTYTVLAYLGVHDGGEKFKKFNKQEKEK